MERKSTKSKIRRRINKTLALLLASALVLQASSVSALAAAEQESGNVEINGTVNEGEGGEVNASAQADDVEITGDGPIGDMVANALSEEQARTEEVVHITSLSMNGVTAAVTYNTQGTTRDCDLVVAVYAEGQEPHQMLASGTVSVPGGMDETAYVNIEGEIPSYFIASAYLLDRESHEPLCSEYTTQMYTKSMQDFEDMTVADFEEDQVLNLDEDPASNFAVFNDSTAQIGSDSGTMTDNGGGKYTVTDPGAAFTALRAGDTFSYTAPDGTVSIVKVKAVQKSGSTVTITEDEDVELEDVFDYVKLEGGYQQEASDEPRASAIELEISQYSKTERFDWTKRLGSGSLTATLKASGALTAAPYVKIYLALSYQYVELTLTMKANFDCSASGRLSRQSVDLLPRELSFTPVAGVTLTFMPRMEFEASGNVSFAAEIVTVVGFSCDGKNGLVNKSRGPEMTKCDLHVDAAVYLGLGLKPGVRVGILNVDVGSLSLDLQVGAQITGRMDTSAGTGEGAHLCRQCIAGDITGKLKVNGTLSLMVIGEKTATLVDSSKKLTDFYYSFDYNEFGWTTCPHIGSKPIAQGTCGADLQWRLGEDGTLIVSGTGEMTSWPSSSSTPWYNKQDNIKLVVLENGVTSVGASAFAGCRNLTGVTLPEGVTAIGDFAFYSCGNLTDIVLPRSMTDIGNSAFSYCGNLAGIVLPDGVTYLGNQAFYHCSKLASVNIPAGITTIDRNTFSGCTSLEGVEIPENITVIADEAFKGCTGLLDITIPAGVVRIGTSAFSGCSYMLRADIQGGEIGSSAFNGCSSLTTVTLGDNMTAIGNSAFYRCSSLKSIAIPDQVKRIEGAAFHGCKNLADVNLGNGVAEIGGLAFSDCTRLGSMIFPSSLTKIGSEAFDGCTRLSRIQFTGKAPSISINWSGPFENVVATVYYPANDDTWTESKRQNYGGTLTWISYAPASFQSAEAKISEPSAQEILQPEIPADIPENAEVPGSAEEQADVQGILPQEDPNTAFIETAPPTAQASIPALSFAAGTIRAGASRTEQFTGLMPGGDYVLLVSKDLDGAGLLRPSNLLYIAQGRANRRGSLTFTYIPRTDESAGARVFGPDYDARDISGCMVTLSQDSCVYDGEAKEPEVTVQDGASILERDVDFTVSYENNINAGTASVLITGCGGYTGTKAADFTIQKAAGVISASDISRKALKKAQRFSLNASAADGAELFYRSNVKAVAVDGNGNVKVARNFRGRAVITITASATENYEKAVKKITITVGAPAKTALTKAVVSARSRKMALRWKRVANAIGYQIQYATDRSFTKGVKKINVPGGFKTSKTIGGMAKGKRYYVRIRAYRKTAGKTLYSDWSGIRPATMKK